VLNTENRIGRCLIGSNRRKVFIPQKDTRKIQQNSWQDLPNWLIYKYFTAKSLFLKDLAEIAF
jgi:hypothetical protein